LCKGSVVDHPYFVSHRGFIIGQLRLQTNK
jgi:hypothetical protein